MKRQSLVMTTLLAILFLGSMNWTACSKKVVVDSPAPQEAEKAVAKPDAPPAEPAFITAIKEKIKGKENLPAEEVFGNIQILKGMPAGRVIPIMQRAFVTGLGVKCNHCHEFGKWALETKPQKQIARDMWVMMGKINGELLTKIENLQGARPVANCTTCHRGEVIPATNLGG